MASANIGTIRCRPPLPGPEPKSVPCATNPASQIASRTQTNDAYAWTGAANVSRSYTPNALNQLPGDGSATYGYDADGNLASATHVFDAGTGLYDDYTYTYDAENRLVTAVLLKREPAPTPNKTITTNLRYDPLGRLYEVNDSEDGITRFLYDGDDLVAEYNSAGTLLRRYVHGDGADEPEVWFEGSGVADAARRYLYADERGSIVAVSDSAGNKTAIDSYDEYGIPDDGSAASLATKGRFRYTGQAWIPELGMYYYKARMYSPTLGRFMQTDPIGYGDGMNMYNYVHGDPVNGLDPWGLCQAPPGGICVPGSPGSVPVLGTGSGGASAGPSGGNPSFPGCDESCREELNKIFNHVQNAKNEIVVTAKKVGRALDQTRRTVTFSVEAAGTAAFDFIFPPACAADGDACTLQEQLAILEAQSHSDKATRIIPKGIKDARYPNERFAKMSYSRITRDFHGNIVYNIQVHFWRDLETGNEFGFKIAYVNYYGK